MCYILRSKNWHKYDTFLVLRIVGSEMHYCGSFHTLRIEGSDLHKYMLYSTLKEKKLMCNIPPSKNRSSDSA